MASVTGKTWILPKRVDGSLWMQDIVPVLSLPTVVSTDATSAVVGVTISRSGGTLYVVLSTSPVQPTTTQIKAGQNNLGVAALRSATQIPATAGAKTFSLGGLSGTSSMYAHFVHNAGGVDSNVVSTVSFVLANTTPTWSNPTSFNLTRPIVGTVYINNIRSQYLSDPSGLIPSNGVTLQGADANVTYESANDRFAITDPGADGSDTACFMRGSTIVQSSDWTTRINAAGVVWYHSFDTASEVNQFRWVGGYGNDPAAQSAQGPQVEWVPTGGADGTGYMRLTHTGTASDAINWWRPFSPLNAASTGRGNADPGAPATPGGAATLALQSFTPTQGGTQTQMWASGSKPGWYGNAAYQNSFFDGTDFYLQIRVRHDPRRTLSDVSVGKLSSFTTTSNSYTQQELVTYSNYTKQYATGLGIPNYHNMYQGSGYAPIASSSITQEANGTRIQLQSEIAGGCDPYTGSPLGGCWAYSFGWDCFLYHISPGLHNGQFGTHLEVWAATPTRIANQLGYQKIWDVHYTAVFEQGTSSLGQPYRNGWNALLLWIYQNGDIGASPVFTQEYDQVIFSKQFIACPTL